MKYQPTTTPSFSFKRVVSSSSLVVGAVLMALSAPMSAYADVFDDQIKAIQSEVNSYQNQAGKLAAKADTLKNVVSRLTAQKSAIQAQIDLNRTKYNQLVQQISDNEAKLTKQRDLLSVTLTQLYVSSSKSPIEILASSDSIGDYIDQQEYRATIRDQVLTAMKEVKELKQKLTQQKAEVARVLKDQKAQRNTLAAKEAEQATLLAETRGQESAYQNLIGAKNREISSLRAEQAAANAQLGGNVVPGDPNRGGYPNAWYNAPQDSLVDNWGMYNRECVSYTAWKVHQNTGHMSYWGGRGNANQWPAAAQSEGIATGSTPRVHSVAISMSGAYGHAMWVEAVNGNTIYVSQMNYDLAGHYSEMSLSASGLIFIYF